MLVIGSQNSSNSNRLVDVTRELGTDSYLIDHEGQVEEAWLEGQARRRHHVSGASAPEELVQRLVAFFRERGTTDVEELEVIQEDVRFMLPKNDPPGARGPSAADRRLSASTAAAAATLLFPSAMRPSGRTAVSSSPVRIPWPRAAALRLTAQDAIPSPWWTWSSRMPASARTVSIAAA